MGVYIYQSQGGRERILGFLGAGRRARLAGVRCRACCGDCAGRAGWNFFGCSELMGSRIFAWSFKRFMSVSLHFFWNDFVVYVSSFVEVREVFLMKWRAEGGFLCQWGKKEFGMSLGKLKVLFVESSLVVE